MKQKDFALYRFPNEKDIHRVAVCADSLIVVNDIGELKGRNGFVVAPFSVSDECKVVLIDGAESEIVDEKTLTDCDDLAFRTDVFDDADFDISDDERARYARDFRRFHDLTCGGETEKIVLSRMSSVPIRCTLRQTLQMFLHACRLYPDAFVALVSTKATGVWLVATPEILVEGNADEYRTMALAGTMKGGTDAEWSEKNRHEQRIVADFIRQNLKNHATDIRESSPETVQAGDICHLRSLFKFRIQQAENIFSVVKSLHPTPAVCGLPQAETRRFILQNESCRRLYYSGFMGEVNASGALRLYVSLRLMHICRDRCWLYAGGGIMPDSTEWDEWNETMMKMKTMKRLFKIEE